MESQEIAPDTNDSKYHPERKSGAQLKQDSRPTQIIRKPTADDTIALSNSTSSNTSRRRLRKPRSTLSQQQQIPQSSSDAQVKITRHAQADAETAKPNVISDERPSTRPWSKDSTRRPQYNKDAWLKQNVASQIKIIQQDDLQPGSTHVDRSASFEDVCSYNWQEHQEPKICVPGAPPKWIARTLPVTLPPDKGWHYIDQNAHRVPLFSFEPAFRAMSLMSPDHSFTAVDFVANRNSMRHLLSFIQGNITKSFRIDLNMVKNTLFFSRRERFTQSRPPSQGNPEYGHSFEIHMTKPQFGLEDSTGHHRVVRYKLGDLDCMVRYEVDAWMPDADEVEIQPEHKTDANIDSSTDIVNSLQKLSLTNSSTQSSFSFNTKTPRQQKQYRSTQVIPQGNPIPATKLAELKSKGHTARKRDTTPQLWFGRIPHLIIGYHDKGTFTDITVTDTSEEFTRFEKEQQEDLRKLVALIKMLKEVTMSEAKRACVVVCEYKAKPLRLQVYRAGTVRDVLPGELVKKFWGVSGIAVDKKPA